VRAAIAEPAGDASPSLVTLVTFPHAVERAKEMNYAPLQQSTAGGRRLFSLDVLRGAAACLVLVRHVPETTIVGQSFLEPAFQWLRSIGWIGVDLFFVLSGLLISTLIYREYDRLGEFRTQRFLVRRSFKIWPTYFAAYGLTALMQWAAATYRGNGERAARLADDSPWNLLFLQNYRDKGRWPHSWSIAVEEHFYLGLALIVSFWFVLRPSRPEGKTAFSLIPWLWGALAIGIFAVRWQACFPCYSWERIYYPTHMRIDSLFCGVAMGYVAWYRPQWLDFWTGRVGVILGFGALAMLWPTIWPLESDPRCATMGFTLMSLCFSIMIGGAALHADFGTSGIAPFRWICSGLAWIGVYSYTIYIGHSVLRSIPGVAGLWAQTLAVFQRRLGSEATLWLDRIGFWAGSIALGVVLSHAVERPFLRLRTRLYSAGTQH
jgi:peptidoglycan/LPS O-acetylase OafA/YrhL